MSFSLSSADKSQVEALYRALIDAWNRRDAQAYARCFAPDGNAVGFDGSEMSGAVEIEKSLSGIFSHHPTAAYVTIVRQIRPLTNEIVLLRAVAGMVPPGEDRIKPQVNAIQSVLAQRFDAEWKVALLQNTPAAFHGRPADAEALTRELEAARVR